MNTQDIDIGEGFKTVVAIALLFLILLLAIWVAGTTKHLKRNAEKPRMEMELLEGDPVENSDEESSE